MGTVSLLSHFDSQSNFYSYSSRLYIIISSAADKHELVALALPVTSVLDPRLTKYSLFFRPRAVPNSGLPFDIYSSIAYLIENGGCDAAGKKGIGSSPGGTSSNTDILRYRVDCFK